MNPLFHFFFNFSFVALAFGVPEAKRALVAVAIFSSIIDLDHLKYLAKEGVSVFKKRFGAKSRTIFHDFLGLAIFSAIFSAIFFLPGRDFFLLEASMLSIILHLAVDFLVGRAYPLHPFSFAETEFLKFSLKGKVAFELALTAIFGAVFLFLWLSKGAL